MVSLNTTINICEESGQCKNLLELLDEIPQHKLDSGVISCNAAISLFEQDGQLEKTLQLLAAESHRVAFSHLCGAYQRPVLTTRMLFDIR